MKRDIVLNAFLGFHQFSISLLPGQTKLQQNNQGNKNKEHHSLRLTNTLITIAAIKSIENIQGKHGGLPWPVRRLSGPGSDQRA